MPARAISVNLAASRPLYIGRQSPATYTR